MSRKQLGALFASNMIAYAVGAGLMGVMPIYLPRFGVDTAAIGLFMAVIFGSLAAGALSAGWLSQRFGRRKVFMTAAALLQIPVVYLMGQTESLAVFGLLAVTCWFLGGLLVGMVDILVGLSADPARRGRAFGAVTASIALGQIIAGLGAGQIIARWGFEALHVASAALYVAAVVTTLLVEERETTRPTAASARIGTSPALIGSGFGLLLVAGVLANAASFSANLGRTVSMDALNFDAATITSVFAIGGLVNLPLPLVTGWLSDRIGRRSVMVVTYLATAVGVAMLAASFTVWHFWLSMVLLTTIRSGHGVGSALITDMVPPQHLSASLSRYAVTPWIGGVIGYALTGVAFQTLGIVTTAIISAALPLLGALLITSAHQQPAATAVRPAAAQSH